jgi:hypothetical protein
MMPATVTEIGSIEVLGAAFFSTHYASAQDALAARDRPFTPPTYGLLVGRARRFTSLLTQMHIEVCGALRSGAAEAASAVFATCHGEIQTAERLIADFRETATVSSARFALSVHNTASGVWSVATGSAMPTTTVTGDNAIAAGWLEASLAALEAGRAVLLSIADEPVPAALEGPPSPVGVAAGFLIGPTSAPGAASASGLGRRAQLAITRGRDDAPVDPLRTLARAVDSCTGAEPSAIVLGCVQPGGMLELCFAAQDARG